MFFAFAGFARITVIGEEVKDPKKTLAINPEFLLEGEAEIVVKNARFFLKAGGYAMLSIKARSVDVVGEPNKIYKDQVGVLEDAGFRVEQLVELEPYELDHALALSRLT
jgi:fibrillarin-like rRNA methylase